MPQLWRQYGVFLSQNTHKLKSARKGIFFASKAKFNEPFSDIHSPLLAKKCYTFNKWEVSCGVEESMPFIRIQTNRLPDVNRQQFWFWDT